MSSSSTPITFKIYFLSPNGKQEIRRFTPSSTAQVDLLSQVLSYLNTTYSSYFAQPLRFLLQYEDAENDMVAVSSQVELQEAIRLTAGSTNLMKLWCQLDQSQTATSGLQTPMSAVSDISSTVSNDFPPSPSRVSQHVAVDVPQSSSVVEEPIKMNDTTSLLTGVRSDDDDGVEIASADGHSSEDEYERIEVDQPTSSPSPAIDSPKASAPVVVTPAVAIVESPAAVSTQTSNVQVETCSTQTSASNTATATTQSDSIQTAPVTTDCDTQTPSLESIAIAAQPIHRGFSCDGCMMSPIVGERYHCLDCHQPGGFDLCVVCHATGSNKHPDHHRMKKIAEPVQTTSVQASSFVVNAPSLASASSSSSSSSSSPKRVIHTGIICDGCGKSPIVGDRYHCTVCTMAGGFDLCSDCESAVPAKHPVDHVLLKMKVAAHIPVGSVRAATALHCPRSYGNQARRCPAQQQLRPKCQFISDVTLADGLKVKRGEVVKKIWSIKNSGTTAWPANTRLVFCGGELMPESDNRLSSGVGAIVPYAEPNSVVHVAIDIQVPNETGRFRATFRLETPDGLRFGPRIWLDLSVPEDEEADSNAQSGSDDDDDDEDSESDSDSDPSSDEDEDEEIDEEIIVESIKSATAPPVPAASAPSSSVATPSAPVAESSLAPSAPSAPSSTKNKQSEEEVALAQEFTQAVKIETQAQLASAAVSSAPAVVESSVASNVASAPSGAVQPTFQYSNQLASLRSMGFKDQALCSYLLLNNRGDLEKVVQWLLNNASA